LLDHYKRPLLKKILFICLLLIQASAWAEWRLLSESVTSKVFTESKGAKKSKGLMRILTMIDYKSLQTHTISSGGYSYISSTALHEVNCTEETKKIVLLKYYSDNMGLGKLVYSIESTKPEMYILPDSFDEAIFRIACKK
jgi:hypothetical protein